MPLVCVPSRQLLPIHQKLSESSIFQSNANSAPAAYSIIEPQPKTVIHALVCCRCCVSESDSTRQLYCHMGIALLTAALVSAGAASILTLHQRRCANRHRVNRSHFLPVCVAQHPQKSDNGQHTICAQCQPCSRMPRGVLPCRQEYSDQEADCRSHDLAVARVLVGAELDADDGEREAVHCGRDGRPSLELSWTETRMEQLEAMRNDDDTRRLEKQRKALFV